MVEENKAEMVVDGLFVLKKILQFISGKNREKNFFRLIACDIVINKDDNGNFTVGFDKIDKNDVEVEILADSGMPQDLIDTIKEEIKTMLNDSNLKPN